MHFQHVLAFHLHGGMHVMCAHLQADAEGPDAQENVAPQDALEHIVLVFSLTRIDLIKHLHKTQNRMSMCDTAPLECNHT